MQEKAHYQNVISFYEYHNSIIPARAVIDCAIVQFITSAMVMAKSCFLHGAVCLLHISLLLYRFWPLYFTTDTFMVWFYVHAVTRKEAIFYGDNKAGTY